MMANICKVKEPSCITIGDLQGNYVFLSLGRGKTFEYSLSDDKLTLKRKGMFLTIPRHEFEDKFVIVEK